MLLGHTPATPSLDQLFDWPDAHVHVPFGSRDIAEVIHQLDADPERVNTIRRNNVVNSLRRHDWAYRWQAVLHQLQIEPTARLGERRHNRGQGDDAPDSPLDVDRDADR